MNSIDFPSCSHFSLTIKEWVQYFNYFSFVLVLIVLSMSGQTVIEDRITAVLATSLLGKLKVDDYVGRRIWFRCSYIDMAWFFGQLSFALVWKKRPSEFRTEGIFVHQVNSLAELVKL